MRNNEHGRGKILSQFSIVAVFVLLTLGSGTAYYFVTSERPASTGDGLSAVAVGSAPAHDEGSYIAAREAPPGMRVYRSEHYRFELFYPQGLVLNEYEEGGGAMTITFQNIESEQGFQIFVLPYSDTQLSEDRFRRDNPSGVRQNPRDVAIDGANATTFYGTNALLGDTAEIWFIHGSYLFEVTAHKVQAEWLSDIIATWKWIY